MVLLPLLLTCVLLRALSAQARVVPSFSECDKFFYKRTEPGGMDQNAKKICQKLELNDHYATLYNTHHRLAVYSAYTLGEDAKESDGKKRSSSWFIEPQISIQRENSEMSREGEFNINTLKRFQAIDSDYSKTGYDRGHLNPNCFQCEEGRDATFTLTNAAPMDPCFNRVHWYQWERGLRKLLRTELDAHPEATAYIVTGTVPHPKYRIPRRQGSAQAQSSDFERVTVPTHIWTAVCFEDPSNNDNSFSFGYIGPNRPESSITMMSVPELNSDLSELYQRAGGSQSSSPAVKIFVDECYYQQSKYQQVTENLKNLIPLSAALHIPDDMLSFFRMPNQQDPTPLKRRCPDTSESKRTYSTMGYGSEAEFFRDLESMKCASEKACVLFGVGGPTVFSSVIKDELRKREVGSDQGSDTVRCQQVPEKSDAGAMTAADGTRCESKERYCVTKKGFKPCCTTPCLYQEASKGYRCLSGQVQIQCSPQYSTITANGEKCKDDHPCATYGEDYYWCKTSDSWDYCSPPLWNSKAKDGKYCRPNYACAKYGKSYNWCYTDYDNSWNYCCPHDDCAEA
ncbi:uncharacterized protein [Salminus brasiliensis]|uniref:uncharacterized protein n=1 Tax=Salminus brasiliensis TaxID=930266 RepID=UPI003B835B44